MEKRTIGLLLMGAAGIYLLWPRNASAAELPAPAEPVAPKPPTPTPPTSPSASSTPATGMATIRRGSTGPSVVAWQSYLGITADGNFGSGTEAATKQWQTKMGLKADGVVGPASWAMATAGAKPAAKAAAAAAGVTPAKGWTYGDDISKLTQAREDDQAQMSIDPSVANLPKWF